MQNYSIVNLQRQNCQIHNRIKYWYVYLIQNADTAAENRLFTNLNSLLAKYSDYQNHDVPIDCLLSGAQRHVD